MSEQSPLSRGDERIGSKFDLAKTVMARDRLVRRIEEQPKLALEVLAPAVEAAFDNVDQSPGPEGYNARQVIEDTADGEILTTTIDHLENGSKKYVHLTRKPNDVVELVWGEGVVHDSQPGLITDGWELRLTSQNPQSLQYDKVVDGLAQPNKAMQLGLGDARFTSAIKQLVDDLPLDNF